MDTVGAVAGPLLGVALLGWAQGRTWSDPTGPFRLVFWLTLITGLLAVLAFLLLVQDPEHSPNPALRFFAALRTFPLASSAISAPWGCSARAISHPVS